MTASQDCGHPRRFGRDAVDFVRDVQRRLNSELLEYSYNRQWLRAVGKPVVFQVELTNNCPMTCQMCPRTHAMTRPLGNMQFDMYRRLIDEAKASTSKLFLHHFGDSLVHPEIGRFVGYAARNGIGSYLSANPALLTRTRIQSLVDNGLAYLTLSLDGLTGATSEAVRGRAARNVELAEQRIDELLEYRRTAGVTNPEITLQFVRQRQNVDELDGWLKKWRAKPDVDHVRVKAYSTWNGEHDPINALQLERRPSSTVVCMRPWTTVTVLWDGRVVPCCFDYDGQETLGNIADSSLREVWRGEPLRRLRAHHRDGTTDQVPLCAHCEDREGYPVRKVFYPLNRIRHRVSPIGNEWVLEEPRTSGSRPQRSC